MEGSWDKQQLAKLLQLQCARLPGWVLRLHPRQRGMGGTIQDFAMRMCKLPANAPDLLDVELRTFSADTMILGSHGELHNYGQTQRRHESMGLDRSDLKLVGRLASAAEFGLGSKFIYHGLQRALPPGGKGIWNSIRQ